MKNYLKHLNKKKRQSHQTKIDGFKNWDTFEAQANEIFERTIVSAEEIPFYEKLYITTDTVIKNQVDENYTRFIQLSLGNRPSGRSDKKLNKDGKVTSWSLEAILVGALVISQAVNGAVTFAMYPDKLDSVENNHAFIKYQFVNPRKIKYAHIKDACTDFLKFVQYTAPDHVPSRIEKLEIYMLKGKWQSDALSLTVKALSWGLRIASFLK